MWFTLSLALRMTIVACPLGGGAGVFLGISYSGPDQLGYCFLILPPLAIVVVCFFYFFDDIEKFIMYNTIFYNLNYLNRDYFEKCLTNELNIWSFCHVIKCIRLKRRLRTPNFCSQNVAGEATDVCSSIKELAAPRGGGGGPRSIKKGSYFAKVPRKFQ